MEKEYLSLPIVPGVGVAGITLGENKENVEQKLGASSAKTRLQSGGEKLDYDSIKVWLSSGKVMQVAVCKGYLGKTADQVGVGVTRDELKNKWGLDLAWHEGEEMWSFLSKPGIGFNFGKDGEDIEKISAVYIFSKNT